MSVITKDIVRAAAKRLVLENVLYHAGTSSVSGRLRDAKARAENRLIKRSNFYTAYAIYDTVYGQLHSPRNRLWDTLRAAGGKPE